MTMTGLERKIALLKNGITMQSIADGLGVTIAHVSAVTLGKARSPRVEVAIAAAIGKSVAATFPPPIPARTTRRPKQGAA